MNMNKLLSTVELAEFLGVPVNTIYKWNYRLQGPPKFKIGKYLRYDRLEVLQWLEGHRSGALERIMSQVSAMMGQVRLVEGG